MPTDSSSIKRKPSALPSSSPSNNRSNPSRPSPFSPGIGNGGGGSSLLSVNSSIKKEKRKPKSNNKNNNLGFDIPEIVIEAPKESDNVGLIQINVDNGVENTSNNTSTTTTNRRSSIIGSLVMAAATSTRSLIASLSSKKMPSTPIIIQLDPPTTKSVENVQEEETDIVTSNQDLQIEIPSASTTIIQTGKETLERSKEITKPPPTNTNIPSFKLSINLPTLVLPKKQQPPPLQNSIVVEPPSISVIPTISVPPLVDNETNQLNQSNQSNQIITTQETNIEQVEITIPTQQPDVTTQSIQKPKNSPKVERLKSLPNLNPSRLNQSPRGNTSPTNRGKPTLESYDSSTSILNNLDETIVEMNRIERDLLANHSTLPPQQPPVPTLKPNSYLTVTNTIGSNNTQQGGTSKSKAMSRSILFDMEKENESKTKKTKQLQTPWGTIEMSCWKSCSLFGLGITILLLVSLLICVTVSFIYRTSELEARLNAKASDLKAVLSDMHILTHQIVYRGFTTEKYHSYMSLRAEAWNYLWNLTEAVEYEYEHKLYLFSMYSLTDYKHYVEIPTREILWVFTEVVNKMYFDQADSAQEQIQAFEEGGGTKNVSESISILREYSLSLFVTHDHISYIAGSMNLIIGVLSLIIVIPVLILSFTLSLNKDALHRKRWKKANAIVLLDTMADDQLRDLFRLHCEKEMALENFLFLQEVSIYNDLCTKAIEAQDTLYGADLELGSASSSVASTTTTIMQNHSKRKHKSFKVSDKSAGTFLQGSKVLKRFGWVTDRDIDSFEQKKYEKAFEIYKLFLDVHGNHSVNTNKTNVQEIKDAVDGFETGEVDFLPDTLFDTLENEIAVLLVDTHRRFKKTLAFQKQMKIEKYIQLKKRSRRNTTISDQ